MQELQRHLDTTQRERLSPDQVKNSAGGYVYQVDAWERLRRFLILGAEGGTFYARERELTRDNVAAVRELLQIDGVRVVDEAVRVSDQGLAYKNDYALFVMALAISEGDEATRAHARANLAKVARIPTHLFAFMEYAQSLRGWGRALRKAVAGWYDAKDLERLAHTATKYQNRNGWTHRDALRVAHPKASGERNALYRYLAKGELPGEGGQWRDYLRAVEAIKVTTSAGEAAMLIRDFDLPREVVPTQLLNEKLVWEALLERMPMTAMIRQLATMTRVGLLTPGSRAADSVAEALTDQARIERARVHPIQVLAALKTYAGGRGARGSGAWEPVASVVDALDAAFYLSFRNVTPTGKRVMYAIDVSLSMTWHTLNGVPGLTPRVGAAALALLGAATERHTLTAAFSHGMVPLAISPRQRLDDVIKTIEDTPVGGTDCALPMQHALANGLEVDAFVVLTDNETHSGRMHPMTALKQYRDRTGIPAKLIVVGMTATGFTIADPNDAGALDVVGFDPSVPQLISDFIR